MFFDPLRNLANEIIQTDINKIVNSILKNTDFNQFVLDLNRIDQLFEQGIQIDGSPVTSSGPNNGTYSKASESLSQGLSFKYKDSSTKRKIAGEPFNFVNTGEWFNSFRLIIKDDSFIIQAVNVHGIDMEAAYGQLLGLTDESMQELINAIAPILRQRLINRLTR